MDIVALDSLEIQITTLIQNLERSKTENLSLKKQLAESANERAGLKEKNKQAATRVREIIGQLKEEMA